MGRKILAVIVGYVLMCVIIFAGFYFLYMALGTEGAFKPGLYEASTNWIVATSVLGLVGAVIGGCVCASIAKSRGPAKAMVVVAIVIGLIMVAMPLLMDTGDAPTIRTGEVAFMDAGRVAKEPIWVSLLNFVIVAAGILIGARFGAKNGA